jgi:hypothetical protein
MSNDLTHLIGAICSRCDPGDEGAIPPSKLLAVGEITWAGNIPRIDRIPDDNI